MCKNGANLAFHACLQQNGVTALTPENAERKLTKKKMPPSDCINCCTRKFGMNSINHHFSFRDSSWLLVINWFVIQSMYNLQTQRDIFMLNENLKKIKNQISNIKNSRYMKESVFIGNFLLQFGCHNGQKFPSYSRLNN